MSDLARFFAPREAFGVEWSCGILASPEEASRAATINSSRLGTGQNCESCIVICVATAPDAKQRPDETSSHIGIRDPDSCADPQYPIVFSTPGQVADMRTTTMPGNMLTRTKNVLLVLSVSMVLYAVFVIAQSSPVLI
jgi:hypothetical protein